MTQPDPKPGREDVWPKVMKDLHDRLEGDLVKRVRLGQSRYGTVLQTENGRDALADAYDEAWDLVIYLKQAMLERDARRERGET